MVPTLTAPAYRLGVADLGWATALLADACADHPMLRHCCTGPAAAPQRAWLLGRLLRFGLRYGRVYANAERTALAVWLGPGQLAASRWQLLRAGLLPAALWRLDRHSWRRVRHYLAATAWLRRQSMASPRHHYLLALAVQPAQRGRGLGRRLLHATLALTQATDATACYAETQVAEQLPFYQRLGFQLTGQCPAGPGAPWLTTWGLVRAAPPH
jgi:ribosomal protein S18 acetylase RimI-like enzyme